MTAKEHNKLIGIFFLVNAGLSAIGGIIAALIYGGMGMMMVGAGRREEDQMIGGIFLVAAVVVGILIVLFAGFYGFAGWKIYKEQSIGRTLGIIASAFSLLSPPLGTALGVYGLWFLLGEQGKSFYNGSGMPSVPPPPPNSWQ